MYETVNWKDGIEMYLFLVHTSVNVEDICADLGFECLRVYDGMLELSEYNSNFHVDSSGFSTGAKKEMHLVRRCSTVRRNS